MFSQCGQQHTLFEWSRRRFSPRETTLIGRSMTEVPRRMFKRTPRASQTRWIVGCLVCLFWMSVGQVRGQEPNGVGWPMESLILNDSTLLHGVVLGTNKKGVEFAEVVRPPGKPMFVVIRQVLAADIKQRRELPSAERAKSLEQLAKFRHRVRIEQGNMESVHLAPADFEGFSCRRFENAWFTLWSAADDETTRRCVVRVDQVFRAYRQLFSAREDKRPLRILLLGSLEQYGDYLRRHGLNVQNPAFYSQRQNLIVAASEVGDFGMRLAELRKRHDRRIAKLEQMDKDLLAQFSQLRFRLKSAGYSAAEITREKNARLRSWKDERERTLKQINAANRRNDAKFQQLTHRMFKRLYHEAFHAYLENHVYPERQYALPRWFNEGLAQVFESGRLEAGLLRIDAPDSTLLRRLKQDLQHRPKLSVEDLVATGPGDFVDGHENPQSDRYYLHAWAVAYYLTFLSPKTADQMDAFARSSKTSSLERLEEFAGLPASELDRKWRSAMFQLSAPD